jgi:hypothetical protein
MVYLFDSFTLTYCVAYANIIIVMDNPLLTPEHEKSELQKHKLFYEHVDDKRPARRTKQAQRK